MCEGGDLLAYSEPPFSRMSQWHPLFVAWREARRMAQFGTARKTFLGYSFAPTPETIPGLGTPVRGHQVAACFEQRLAPKAFANWAYLASLKRRSFVRLGA
jgi:hypothetical protein